VQSIPVSTPLVKNVPNEMDMLRQLMSPTTSKTPKPQKAVELSAEEIEKQRVEQERLQHEAAEREAAELELAAQRRLDALNALTNPSLLSQVPR
jgi:membrane protein involved in colicin uptake